MESLFGNLQPEAMIQLRPAAFSDYPAIAGLHADNWRRYYRGIYSDAFLDADAEEERSLCWKDRLTKPTQNQRITLALLNNKLAGFACVFLNDDEIYGSLLDNLHIAAGSQKAGVGKILLADCAAIILREANTKQMYLWVYEKNKNAVAVYEHLGGRMIETVQKENVDGTKAFACRFAWDDVSVLL